MSSSCNPWHAWRILQLLIALLVFTAPDLLFAQRRSAAARKSTVEKPLPNIVRAVYLPAELIQEDSSLTASLSQNLNDISANLVVLELAGTDGASSASAANETSAAVALFSQAARTLEEAKSLKWIAIFPKGSIPGKSVPRVDGVLFRLSGPSDDFSTLPFSQQTTSTWPGTTATEWLRQLPPQLSAGVQFTIQEWEESTSATRDLLLAADLLCPDLASLGSSGERVEQPTSKRLRELAGAAQSVRVAPWVDVEVATSPSDLEAAIRGCIETVGGVLVVLPSRLPDQEIWDAIRRGFQASYLLPEG